MAAALAAGGSRRGAGIRRADSVLPPLGSGEDVLERITRLPPSEEQTPITRLPPVVVLDSILPPRQPERVALLPPSADNSSFFSSPTDPGRPYDPLDQEILKEDAPALPPGFKNGVLQFTTFRKTFLMQGPRDTGMGMESFLLQTTLALPFFTRDKPIFITPYFQANILQGPVPVDLPPQLYDVRSNSAFCASLRRNGASTWPSHRRSLAISRTCRIRRTAGWAAPPGFTRIRRHCRSPGA